MNQILLILDISNISPEIQRRMKNSLPAFFLESHEFEHVFDWCIKEALEHVVSGRVSNHYSYRKLIISDHEVNDAYLNFYEDIRSTVETLISGVINANRLHFLEGKELKVLVTFREIVIVTNTSPV